MSAKGKLERIQCAELNSEKGSDILKAVVLGLFDKGFDPFNYICCGGNDRRILSTSLIASLLKTNALTVVRLSITSNAHKKTDSRSNMLSIII
jgi:hypothetical protein